jgi:hypothetical protein
MGDSGLTKWDYTEVNDKDRLIVLIGESKKDKYLLKFGMRVYDNSSKTLPSFPKLSWNWSAFFAGLLWMGYRKMYMELFIFYILSLLPYIFFPKMSNNADAIITTIQWILFGLMANLLYFFCCKRKITRIKKLNLSMYDELELLNQTGGTSVAGIFISLLTLVIDIAIFVVAYLYWY